MFYYSTSILEKAGVKESRVASCAVGVVSVIMTGVTVSTTCFDSLRMFDAISRLTFWSDNEFCQKQLWVALEKSLPELVTLWWKSVIIGLFLVRPQIFLLRQKLCKSAKHQRCRSA